jgi:hypothetical protein
MATTYWRAKATHPHVGAFWVVDDGVGDYHVFGDNPPQIPNPLLGPYERTAPLEKLMERGLGENPLLRVTKLGPGEYHSRIWRPSPMPYAQDMYEVAWWSASEVADSLKTKLANVFRYVTPTPDNFAAHGDEIRQLLILACAEFEAQAKAVLRAQHYPEVTKKGTPRRWNVDDYRKLALPMRLHECEARLFRRRDLPPFKPFEPWGTPDGKLPWYEADHATRHDREMEFRQANLGNLIQAVAAVDVLVSAQFGRNTLVGAAITDSYQFHVRAPPFDPSEEYMPPHVGGLTDWKPVDYAFPA